MGAQYTYGHADSRPWYRRVVQQDKLRILIFSGDADTCVNTLWSEWWTSELGLAEIEGGWRAWTVDNETAMAGYVTRYEHSFDFLTVRVMQLLRTARRCASTVSPLCPQPRANVAHSGAGARRGPYGAADEASCLAGDDRQVACR